MINLLPTENQVINKKKYLSRLFLTVGFLVFILSIISFVLFLPVFLSLFFEEKDLTQQLNVIKKADSSVESEKIYTDLDVLNTRLSIYDKNSEEVRQISSLVKGIISLKADGIIINYIKYDKDKSGKIIITGKSDSRSDFVDFKKRVEEDSSFSAVNSPLSSLLKETDISFTMTIEL